NYSNAAARHYNYSRLLYGMCLSDIDCRHHVKGNSTPELMRATEACINDTLRRKYDLGVRVEKVNCYRYKEKRHQLDYIDNLVFYVLAGIVALNLLSTIYDFAYNDSEVAGWPLIFSLRANWRRLVAPPSKDPRRSKLIGINGIRFLTAVLVLLGHAPIPPVITIENPQWLEDAFDNVAMQSLFQGHMITQTFFLLSGFFLTYNLQFFSGKLTWKIIPKGILLRWLRIAPVTIVMVALTATWFKFSNYGPFWQESIGVEVDDCRKDWPSVIFYYNNYNTNSTCNLQNWSMACDMQLHIIGLMVVVLSPTVKARNRAIFIFFLLGMIFPALEVYFRGVDGNFLITAEAIRNYLVVVPTFKYLYVPTHTNMPCFFMGMYLGYYLTDIEQIQIPKKLRKVFAYTFWTLFPWMLFLPITQYFLFVADGSQSSMWMRIIHAMVEKPLQGLIVSLIIIGMVIKIEELRFYSWILESPIWVPLAKLSYSMFATHVMIVRYVGGTKASMSHITLVSMIQEFAGLVTLSLFFGFIMYMLVEAPFGEVVKLLAFPSTKSKSTVKANGNGVHIDGKIIQNGNGNSTPHNGNIREFQSNGKSLKTE
ncbi:hypothetical protein evm_010996, partial [Chilo suppressalis]